MSRVCEVCGRPLRTGIKYCYTCRSLQKAGFRRKSFLNEFLTDLGFLNPWTICITGIIIFFIGLFNKDSAWFVFGMVGGVIGFPLLLGLIAKFLTDKRKKNTI